MDLISGESSSLFIRYSGIDIWVSLLSRFLLVALLYFKVFFELSFFFFVHFHTLFLLEGGNERGLRDNDIKFVESFSFFSGGILNHVGVTNLGFLEFP